MPKRKRQPVKRTRRSSFENSLEYATNKLKKCLARQSVIESELDSLRKEIPYLQTVIRALTPPEARTAAIPQIHLPPRIGTIIGNAPHNSTPLPDNIKSFIEPISANVDELPGEEDKFLDVKIPGERELLS